MKTQELLELAALDALGLLDEGEREAFDVAFRVAPPAVQAQIRREQTRIAGDDSLLPGVDAPIGLKARVLAAWQEAVDAVSTRGKARRLVGAFTLLPSRGVSPLWRAGAIGCAAASIVLAVAMFTIKGDFEQYVRAGQQNKIDDLWLQEYGARFRNAVMEPGIEKVNFARDGSSLNGRATLLLDPRTRRGQFLCDQLPASQSGRFLLVALDLRTGEPLLDANGRPVHIVCELPAEAVQRGSLVNVDVRVSEEVGRLGLMVTDEVSGQQTLLLRSNDL